MHGRHEQPVSPRCFASQDLSSFFGDLDPWSEDRARGGRTSTTINCGVDLGDLGVQPGFASHRMGQIRLLVDPPLAALDEAEVLDRVGQIGVLLSDPCLVHRAMQQAPGRPDERLTVTVLHVSGLLADEHHLGVRGTAGEHDLSCRLPEFAPSAACGRGPKTGEVGSLGNPLLRTPPTQFLGVTGEPFSGRWRCGEAVLRSSPFAVTNQAAPFRTLCAQGPGFRFDPGRCAHDVRLCVAQLT